MEFCARCGAPVDGQFCGNCGAPAPAGPGPAYSPPAGQPSAGGLAENLACTLCYLLGVITGVLFLVLEPYNRNRKVRFHAFQAIFGHVALIVIWMLAGALLPWGVTFFLLPLIGVGATALWLFLMWKAYRNEMVRLPLIGDLAEKQA